MESGERETFEIEPVEKWNSGENAGVLCILDVQECDTQKEAFSSSYVDRDRVLHPDTLPFCCSHCGKRCKDDLDFERHMKFHEDGHGSLLKNLLSDERSYTCDTCGKEFSSKSFLKIHMAAYSDLRSFKFNGGKFKCDRCRKTMSSRSNLVRHFTVCKLYNRNTEKTPKPYSCHVCEKTFRTAYHVRRHMSIHSDFRDHGCGICLKAFKHKSHVISHIKRVHPTVQDNPHIYCIRSQYPPQSEYPHDEKNAEMPQTGKLTPPRWDDCLHIDHNGMFLNSNAVSSANVKENLLSGINKEVESIPGCDVMERDGSHSDDDVICMDNVSSALDTRVGGEDDVIVGRENKNLELKNIESLNNLSEQTPSLGIMITEVTSLSNHKETNNSQSHDANPFEVHDVGDDADSLQQNRWEETGRTAVEENLFSQSGSFCDETVNTIESYKQSSEKTLGPLRYTDGFSVEDGHIIEFSYSNHKSCGSVLQEPLYTLKNSDPLQFMMPVESHYSKATHSNYVLSDELYLFMPCEAGHVDRRASFLEIQAVSEWMGKEFFM